MMAERCIDASVAIKWVVQHESWRQKARQLLFDSLNRGYALIAPMLFVIDRSILEKKLEVHFSQQNT
jgi:predicted nucleic acid-binding protein